jgi:hypothetical protein
MTVTRSAQTAQIRGGDVAPRCGAMSESAAGGFARSSRRGRWADRPRGDGVAFAQEFCHHSATECGERYLRMEPWLEIGAAWFCL